MLIYCPAINTRSAIQMTPGKRGCKCNGVVSKGWRAYIVSLRCLPTTTRTPATRLLFCPLLSFCCSSSSSSSSVFYFISSRYFISVIVFIVPKSSRSFFSSLCHLLPVCPFFPFFVSSVVVAPLIPLAPPSSPSPHLLSFLPVPLSSPVPIVISLSHILPSLSHILPSLPHLFPSFPSYNLGDSPASTRSRLFS